MTKGNKGITLIALAITVVVLLILSGIAISQITDDNGIIKKAFESKEGYEEAEKGELDYLDEIRKEAEKEYGDGGGSNIPSPDIPEIKENETTSGGSIANSAGVIEIAWLDLENKVIENPLAPKLKTGMQPIKWNGVTEANAGTTASPSSDWYSYKAQTGATDGKTSNWANVKLTDGSYFVWIPRYAYKIIYFDTEEHANDYRTNGLTDTNKQWIQGYSTVHGMIDKNNKVVANTNPNIDYKVKTAGYTDYIPHPAFLGTGYENLGGGFGTNNKGIDGFWMAKFEMSMENSSGTNVNTSNTTIGNVALSSNAKMVSKPNVRSWRYINPANIYTNSYNYDRDKESHLSKNSEWGAVAYLTHSKYGRNGTEVRINNNTSYYTGWGATSHDQSWETYNASSTDNLWTGQYGQLASTTGNITGIYDLSGSAFEYTASGSHFAYEANGTSTKYATAYSNDSNIYNATNFSDFTNGREVSHIGDGIHEVWKDSVYGWIGGYSYFVNSDYPFFVRGGCYNDGAGAGVFTSDFNDRFQQPRPWFSRGVCTVTLSLVT